jgi:hypothetical protein
VRLDNSWLVSVMGVSFSGPVYHDDCVWGLLSGVGSIDGKVLPTTASYNCIVVTVPM